MNIFKDDMAILSEKGGEFVRKQHLTVIWGISLVLLLVGCTGDVEKFVSFDGDIDTVESEALENELKEEKHVEKAIAIFAEKDLLVAVQVKPWQKWQKTKIEERLQKKYKKKYPNYKVLVSADYKIYFEATKLLSKDEENISKTIKDLKKLAKEET